MTVSLLSVLTVIAVVWWIFLILWAISGDDLACILALVITLASTGLLLYRFGELISFIAGELV